METGHAVDFGIVRADEHDEVPFGVRSQNDGSYLVDGRVTIRDLNRRLNWELPDDDAATIAGLVIQIGKVIPEEGQIFIFEEFRFQVASRRKNRLAVIHITPPNQTEINPPENHLE